VVVKELTMHIHRSQMDPSAGNPYTAAAQKAVAAQRAAAAVRKRLTKSAREIEGGSSPDEASMIGRWMDSRYSPAQSEKQ
jgi:hypothetical protein